MKRLYGLTLYTGCKRLVEIKAIYDNSVRIGTITQIPRHFEPMATLMYVKESMIIVNN
jgi:hypothetical protein